MVTVIACFGEPQRRINASWALNTITKWRRNAKVALTEGGWKKPCMLPVGRRLPSILKAGLTLAQVSRHLGESIRYAMNVIVHYATASPTEPDVVLAKLNELWKRGDTFKLKTHCKCPNIGAAMNISK